MSLVMSTKTNTKNGENQSLSHERQGKIGVQTTDVLPMRSGSGLPERG